MALIAADILTAAELLAFPYATEASVAPGVLLRELTQADKEVAGLFQLTAPERVNLPQTIAVVEG
jgi:hypothetical protein